MLQFYMLNNLKKKIENNSFSEFTNIEIRYNELVVSANSFSGYTTIEEQTMIGSMVDTKIYVVEYLNDNAIKVKLK